MVYYEIVVLKYGIFQYGLFKVWYSEHSRDSVLDHGVWLKDVVPDLRRRSSH